MNFKERKEELKNSFCIKDDDNLLKNKDVIVVDDIFTTGSTANEISKMLRLSCVNKITIMTLLTRSVDPYIPFTENN